MFKPMSDLEQYLYFKLVERDQRVFTIKEIADILDISLQHARNIASDMVKKNIAERVKPGLYIRIPESILLNKKLYREDAILIANKSIKKGYLSHYTALYLHGLAERYTKKIYITSSKHHRDIVYHDITIKYVYTNPKRYFGIETIEYSNEKITISNIERTIIDVINKPWYSGGWRETINCLKNIENINWEKLLKYIIRFNNKTLARKIGYIIENLEYSIPDNIKKKIKEWSGENIYYFDNHRKGFLDKNWNIIIPEEIYKMLYA